MTADIPDAKFVAAAKVHEDLGTIQFDADAVVSRNTDSDGNDGAYVSCWVWVSNQEAENV